MTLIYMLIHKITSAGSPSALSKSKSLLKLMSTPSSVSLALLTSMFILLPVSIHAQVNLVPNGDIELYDACPAGLYGLDYYLETTVLNWLEATVSSSDYYHPCATIASGMTVPSGYFFSYQQAHSGDGYLGIYLKSVGSEYREYVTVELIAPLEAGRCYYFEMDVAPNETNSFGYGAHATDKVGVHFSESRIGPLDPFFIGALTAYTPQIENPSGSYITDTLNWTKVSGIYPAMGGEQWITIGNFYNDAETGVIDFLGYGGSPLVYVAIDDVLLVDIDDYVLATDTSICVGETVVLAGLEGADAYLWSTGETTPTLEVSSDGVWYLESVFPCGTITDTFTVSVETVAEETSLSNQEICYYDLPLTLSAPLPYTTYNWSNGETSSSIAIDEAGTYVLTGGLDCVLYIDTFTVSVVDAIPEAMLLDTVQYCPYFGPAVLTGPDGFDSYSWSNGWTGQEITVNNEGVYTLTYEKDCDVYEHDFVTVYLDDCDEGLFEIYLPNAFSPNGDGSNDTYGPTCAVCSSFISLAIYNRWGEQVFYTEQVNSRWDGTFLGADAEVGSYIYIMEYADPIGNKRVSGTISLLR